MTDLATQITRLSGPAIIAAAALALSACASGGYRPVGTTYSYSQGNGAIVCYGGVGSRLPQRKDPHKVCGKLNPQETQAMVGW